MIGPPLPEGLDLALTRLYSIFHKMYLFRIPSLYKWHPLKRRDFHPFSSTCCNLPNLINRLNGTFSCHLPQPPLEYLN